jgi:hypothetical protein
MNANSFSAATSGLTQKFAAESQRYKVPGKFCNKLLDYLPALYDSLTQWQVSST